MTQRWNAGRSLGAIGLALVLVTVIPVTPAWADACRECHDNTEYKVWNPRIFDYYQRFEDSIHDIAGLDCSDCHGGDGTAETTEAIHVGVNENVGYRKIPETCGGCHDTQLASFKTSLHYELLETRGSAPNCVTCHRSHEADVTYTSLVKSTCVICHNAQEGVAPQVPDRTELVLNRINIINGYRSYVSKYSKDMVLLDGIDRSYEELTESWHTFDLDRAEEVTDHLLKTLREAKVAVRKERRKH